MYVKGASSEQVNSLILLAKQVNQLIYFYGVVIGSDGGYEAVCLCWRSYTFFPVRLAIIIL